MKCLTLETYREECYRLTSAVREHITLLPPLLVSLKPAEDASQKHIRPAKKISRCPPLWVFVGKYITTKHVSSTLDPANLRPVNAVSSMRASRRFSSQHPSSLPAPEVQQFYMATSKSGNVNSTIVYNYFKDVVIPFVRQQGITKQHKTLLNWDLHGSHCSQELLELFDAENLVVGHFPGHATHKLQWQDQDEFQVLKTESKKDITAWTIFTEQKKGYKLAIQDFPYVVDRALKVRERENTTPPTQVSLLASHNCIGLADIQGGQKLHEKD